MHLASILLHALHDDRSAEALLGIDHPFVRVLAQCRTLLEQSLVVAVVLLGSVGVLATGVRAMLAFVVAAAVVLAAVAFSAAVLSSSKRAQVLALIVQGRGGLPLGAVERERRRLLEPRHRQRLARSLDTVRQHSEINGRRTRSSELFSIRVIAALGPELVELARRLGSEDAGLRGVAAIERLLIDGGSPLYGHDTDELREELHRIHYLLGGGV